MREREAWSEVMKFPRGLSISGLDTLMNEQSSPITLGLRHTHNNGPLPQRGAGCRRASICSSAPHRAWHSLERSLFRERASAAKSNYCHLLHLRLPPVTKQMIINWSLLCFSRALEHRSEQPQNINCLNLGNFLTSCRLGVSGL